jgi:hypothetical protein
MLKTIIALFIASVGCQADAIVTSAATCTAESPSGDSTDIGTTSCSIPGPGVLGEASAGGSLPSLLSFGPVTSLSLSDSVSAFGGSNTAIGYAFLGQATIINSWSISALSAGPVRQGFISISAEGYGVEAAFASVSVDGYGYSGSAGEGCSGCLLPVTLGTIFNISLNSEAQAGGEEDGPDSESASENLTFSVFVYRVRSPRR